METNDEMIQRMREVSGEEIAHSIEQEWKSRRMVSSSIAAYEWDENPQNPRGRHAREQKAVEEANLQAVLRSERWFRRLWWAFVIVLMAALLAIKLHGG